VVFEKSLLLITGGVAQWLGRRTLAGGLSLTCSRSMVDHFVGKLSATG